MAAHAYWQIRITGNNGSAFRTSIIELEMFDASGNPLCSGGTPSASSTYSTNVAANAFDGSTATGWGSTAVPTSGSPQWLRYQFASPVDVAAIRILVNSGYSNEGPKPFTLQYSDDGSSWTNAAGPFSVTWTGAAPAGSFAVQAPAAGQYLMYRLRVLATQWAVHRPSFAELQFRSSVGGADLTDTVAWHAIALSAYTTHTPLQAFDNNSATDWQSNTNDTGWVGFAFARAFGCVEVAITALTDAMYYSLAPSSCVVEGSNDGGITWTQVGLTLTPATWTAGATQTLALFAAAVTRHGRLFLPI